MIQKLLMNMGLSASSPLQPIADDIAETVTQFIQPLHMALNTPLRTAHPFLILMQTVAVYLKQLMQDSDQP
ncbi:MAG: hypothetical protein ABIK68_20495, partial [bacterium]